MTFLRVFFLYLSHTSTYTILRITIDVLLISLVMCRYVNFFTELFVSCENKLFSRKTTAILMGVEQIQKLETAALVLFMTI